jgi:hypothetical protein
MRLKITDETWEQVKTAFAAKPKLGNCEAFAGKASP